MNRTPHHPTSLRALRLLGASVKAARKERHWSSRELADRVGVSQKTMAKVERGEPGVAIATYLDAAALTGVPIFSVDEQDVRAEQSRLEGRLALLPSRIDRPRRVRNDF